MDKPLVDFLNHGLLPFVGRETELDRLEGFWRLSLEGNELRAGLVIGEAGIGKSRLADELIGRVARAGGVAVRVRLYPESATALAPLLASALWDSDGGKRLLGGRPEETVAAVTAALRRLVRLRPTIVMVEDVHLLAGQVLAEFASILQSLADETAAVLAFARPLELPVRGVLEPYLTENVELHGLVPEELDELWRSLFGGAARDEEMRLLQDATGGNILAVRSALRGALKAGAIEAGNGNGTQRGITFESVLRHNVGLLSEGMAVHLEPAERDAARLLATLGEVFAVEAAAALGEAMKEMLGRLEFRGIIARSASPPMRLAGPASGQIPYAFTHTLLHRHLVEHATVDGSALLRILADGIPLYSLLPLSLLGAGIASLDAPADQLRHAIDRLVSISIGLHNSPNHERAHDVWRIARQLGDHYNQTAGEEEKREVEIILISALARIRVPQIGTDEYQPILDRFLELTEDPLPESLAAYRLNALRVKNGHWYRQHYPGLDPQVRDTFIEEIESFLRQHPALRLTEDYILYLISTAQAASASEGMQRWISSQFHAIMDDPEAGDDFRNRVVERLGPFLLASFHTPDDVREKMELLERIGPAAERELPALNRKLRFLFESGHYGKTTEQAIERAIPRFRDHGLHSQAAALALDLIHIRAVAGDDLEEIVRRTEYLIEHAPPRIVTPFRRYALPNLMWMILLRGDYELGRIVAARFSHYTSFYLYEQILLARDEELLNVAQVIREESEEEAVSRLALLVTGDPRAEREAVIERVKAVFRTPIARAHSSLEKRALLVLLDFMSESQPDIRKTLAAAARFALEDMLEWFATHEAAAFMEPVLERHGNWLSPKDVKGWQARAAAIARKRRAEADAEVRAGSDDKMRLVLFGQIEGRPPAGEPIPVRGGRLRTVLGLLVADRMLRKPLGHREFCYIAAGSDDDLEPENARKTMNNAIFRLRELLGDDVISTDGETPRLNPAAVEVDLLEAYELLGHAERDGRDDALMRAVPALRRALELSRGEVPFPSLYEDFFEALREDFENRLRSAVIDVTARLLRAGDAAGAEELLRPALDAIPDDEELSEMLREALSKLGRRAEAERLKISEAVA